MIEDKEPGKYTRLAMSAEKRLALRFGLFFHFLLAPHPKVW
jgi:hypothetical protein